MVSEKIARANKENARRATGPVSPEAKARTRLNASKFGLFSAELVVAAAGEKQEDLNKLRAMVWGQFKLEDVVIALLVEELATTFWRLQRPRRYETAEIQLCDTARSRFLFEKISQVDSLRTRFLRDFAALCAPPPAPTDSSALVLSLEQTRQQLERKSHGLDFLIGLLKATLERVNEDGCLSRIDEMTLAHVCGVGSPIANACLLFNQIAKKEMEKIEEDKSYDTTTYKQNKQFLSLRIQGQIQHLQGVQRIIEKLEPSEDEAYLATLIMPSAECLEKIHCAEAALSRRFFKTLRLALALKDIELPG